MNNKILLESIALDLKRIAMAYHTNSFKTAARFYTEVQKRREMLTNDHLPKSVIMLFVAMDKHMQRNDTKRNAEDALMYSTIFLSLAKHL